MHNFHVFISPLQDDPAAYKNVSITGNKDNIADKDKAKFAKVTLTSSPIDQSELNREDLELMETRIEGLEDYISQMGQIIESLQKKVNT